MSRRWRPGPRSWLAGACLVAIVAYAPLRSAGYVYDDHRLVASNPVLEGPRALVGAFTKDFSGEGGWRIYRPLGAASLALDEMLFGDAPGPHHAVNVGWHLACVLALYALTRELAALFRSPGRAWGPALAASVFAVHPLASEPVAWISRRPDLIAASCSLAATATCARWLREGHVRWLGLSLTLLVCALLGKEAAVAVPAWILLLTAIAVGRGATAVTARTAWVGAAAMWLPIAGYAILRHALFGSVSEQPTSGVQSWLVRLGEPERTATGVGLLARYVRLVLFPHPLSADYSWRSLPPLDVGSPLAWVGAALLLGTAAALARTARRAPIAAMGLAITATSYALVSNLVVPLGTSFAERLFYLPLAGLCLAGGISLADALERSRLLARSVIVGCAGALLVALGAGTFFRARDWRDDETLFRATLRAYPENVVALTYTAIAARAGGNADEALARYDAALAVDPDYHLARVNRALLYLERGDAARAASEARRVIERDPDPGAAHLTLAHAERALGHLDVAAEEYGLAARDPRTREEALRFFSFLTSKAAP